MWIELSFENGVINTEDKKLIKEIEKEFTCIVEQKSPKMCKRSYARKKKDHIEIIYTGNAV